MAETILAVYDTLDMAHSAVRDLTSAGYDRANIGVAARDYNAADWDQQDVSGSEGSGFGALVGGLTGIVMGLTAITIPGIGAIIAAGPLAAALGAATGGAIGAVAGAATGGLVASLVDLGVPSEDAETYAEHVRRGGALVSVTVDESQVEQVTSILRRHNPIDVDRRATQWRKKGWTGFDAMAEPYTAVDLVDERKEYASGVEHEPDAAIRRYPTDRL
ncbi:MAG: hypothetical protein K8I30_24125 [Anaerolineae bacterium]|nr:hypothetical protein [Anaerolineae bacterium]